MDDDIMYATYRRPVTFPNYSYVFQFESRFVHQATRTWMQDNWTTAFYCCALYLVLIFSGQRLMQSRSRFELRGLLSTWNVLLATFSVMGASRTLPEIVHVIRHHGIYHSVCIPSFIEDDKVSGFWTWMFALSKLPELTDTVFVVLRKKPLIFLHWYHHIVTLLYTWFSYTEYTASARWFVTMNYCVHAVMYTYYALMAMSYTPPRHLAMLITMLQLLQMGIGCAINLWALQLLQDQIYCHITPVNVKLSITMYFSYFVLFARFFYKSYVLGQHRKTLKSKAQ